MVATAPGEKLLTAVRYRACFCAENYICSWENQQKLLLPAELHFLTPNMHQIGWGFAPDPTAELIQRLPKPLAVFRGGG